MASITPQLPTSPTSSGENNDAFQNSRHHPGYQTGHPRRAETFDGFENRVDSGFKSLRRFTHRNRGSTHTSLEDWAVREGPYHRYVHELVAAGWSNLQDLQDYLERPAGQHNEVVSVMDITTDKKHNYPDLKTNFELKNFMDTNKRSANAVRLYMAEYDRLPSAGLIETFGSGLQLDPRFFQWAIHSKGHVFTPSQRHRAPYVALGCGILDSTTRSTTDVEKFKVLVYIRRDEKSAETGWTGLFLFSSRTKINMSIQLLLDPPAFPASIPPVRPEFKSFRQLYLESFEFVDPSCAVKSPFYVVSNLIRLDCFCWNQVITAIREQDVKVGGISDTTIGHAEEITKTLAIVERGGSLSWHGMDEKAAKERQDALVEDLRHLVDQTKLMWEIRDKMNAIRKQNSDARWSALTNAFTYLFAPVTIISGVYGMNVSQISGSSSNPNIWQFFVAVAIFNVCVVLALSISTWIRILNKHGRKAHCWEVLGYSVGKVGSK